MTDKTNDPLEALRAALAVDPWTAAVRWHDMLLRSGLQAWLGSTWTFLEVRQSYEGPAMYAVISRHGQSEDRHRPLDDAVQAAAAVVKAYVEEAEEIGRRARAGVSAAEAAVPPAEN